MQILIGPLMKSTSNSRFAAWFTSQARLVLLLRVGNDVGKKDYSFALLSFGNGVCHSAVSHRSAMRSPTKRSFAWTVNIAG
jgi:hypothetical protein